MKKQNLVLDKDEKKILRDYEKGKYVSEPNFKKRKKGYEEIAKYTLKKTKNINIRLSPRDLHRIKVKAVENGLPYQTLVSTVLHQYADNMLTVSL